MLTNRQSRASKSIAIAGSVGLVQQGTRHSYSVRGLLRLLCVAIAGLAAVALPVAAQQPEGLLRLEETYFNGEVVVFLQPAATSSNPNQGEFGCFKLGPDFSDGHRAAPAPPLYVILSTLATQDSCPDGSTRHDHVLSTAPGFPGYTGSWSLVLVEFPDGVGAADMPFTSVAQVEAAAAAGRVTLIQTGVRMVAPVISGH